MSKSSLGSTADFGDSLKNQATGATAWILAGEPRLAKVIGLKPSRTHPAFQRPHRVPVA